MIFLSLAALVTVVALILVIVSTRDTRNYTPEQIESLVRSMELPAFRNLIETDHDIFLRRNLSSTAFRQLRRKRTLVTLSYLKQLATITTVMIGVGDTARHSADPSIAESGIILSNTAVRTRLMILKTCLECLPLLLFPKMEEFLRPTLVSHCKDMDRRFSLLHSLSQPVLIRAKVRS